MSEQDEIIEQDCQQVSMAISEREHLFPFIPAGDVCVEIYLHDNFVEFTVCHIGVETLFSLDIDKSSVKDCVWSLLSRFCEIYDRSLEWHRIDRRSEAIVYQLRNAR